jgi:hypothetical protein
MVAENTAESGLLMIMIERAMRILKGCNHLPRESNELFQRNIVIRKTVGQPKENDIHKRIHRCTWGRHNINFAKTINQDTNHITKKEKKQNK